MKVVPRNEVRDILNGRSYKFEEDTFNLVIFVDAVTYTKSGNNSMWAMFSTFAELPPVLRFISDPNLLFI
jgi:hypothetical protein